MKYVTNSKTFIIHINNTFAFSMLEQLKSKRFNLSSTHPIN